MDVWACTSNFIRNFTGYLITFLRYRLFFRHSDIVATYFRITKNLHHEHQRTSSLKLPILKSLHSFRISTIKCLYKQTKDACYFCVRYIRIRISGVRDARSEYTFQRFLFCLALRSVAFQQYFVVRPSSICANLIISGIPIQEYGVKNPMYWTLTENASTKTRSKTVFTCNGIYSRLQRLYQIPETQRK